MGALFGTPFLPILGTFFGLFIGGALGACVGVLTAVFVAGIIRFFFTPLTNATYLKWTLYVLGGTFATGVVAVMLRPQIESPESFVFFTVFPSLLAFSVSIWAITKFISWYLTPQAQQLVQFVAPSPLARYWQSQNSDAFIITLTFCFILLMFLVVSLWTELPKSFS
jgi:hypothetical protein